MCFSATASFGSASVLFVAGMAALKRTNCTSQKWLAAVPLFFSLQQFVEGLVWLSLTQPAFGFLEQYSVWLFLFFAQVLWPGWIPFSMFQLEKDTVRKKWLLVSLSAGLSLAICMVVALLMYPVKAEIVTYHIHYIQYFPQDFKNASGIVYFFATVSPAFLTGRKPIIILGIGILITYLITQLLYPDFIVSVWCFFAAIQSIVIIAVLKMLNKKTGKVVKFSQVYPNP